MRQLCIALITFYQRWISPLFLPSCRFEPTCSQYAIEVIRQNGIIRGLGRTIWRLLKCHPFHPGGFDPVK